MLNFSPKIYTKGKMMHMFPLNPKSHLMNTRMEGKYKVYHENTSRFKDSAILYMQKFLTENPSSEFYRSLYDSNASLIIVITSLSINVIQFLNK